MRFLTDDCLRSKMNLRSAIEVISAKLGMSRKSNEIPASVPEPAVLHPPTQREPETDLVATLSREHGQLRKVMSNILEAAKEKRFEVARKELVRFQALLAKHLSCENRDFYPQLKKHLPEYSGNIQRCQADLHGITTELRLVAEIGEKDAVWRAQTISSLQRLFERVEERLSYEENSLFPVYFAIGEKQDIFNKTQIFDRSLYARLKSHP